MRVELNADDARHFAAVRAVDPDVYEAYLKGRYYWNQRTADSLRTAVRHFENRLDARPNLRARVRGARRLLQPARDRHGQRRVAAQWRPKAAEAAIKALQIDGDLAEAHATLGYVRHYNWEWAEAERSFRRAIALNPSNRAGSYLVCELPVLAAAVRRGHSRSADCPRAGSALAHRQHERRVGLLQGAS